VERALLPAAFECVGLPATVRAPHQTTSVTPRNPTGHSSEIHPFV